MAKWTVVVLLAGMCMGLGLWVTLDPQARAVAVKTWNQVGAMFPWIGAAGDGGSLWAPVASAFQGFADSVARLWSPDTVRIEVPSIQIAP
jgi:hypothetical protein